jgi:hypothetical protein
MHFLMCQEQLEAFLSDDVGRMTIGPFNCGHAASAEGVEDACDEVRLWEADLESEPECGQCLKAGCACGDSPAIGRAAFSGFQAPSGDPRREEKDHPAPIVTPLESRRFSA